MKVLIVDDDFYCRTMVHEMLRPYAECDIAVNGEEAIEAFRKSLKNGEPYDLVCLDLVMPEIDGHKALREMRAMEGEMGVHKNEEAQVIVTTVLDDKEETHDAFFLGGATSYLVKPIDEKKLLAELENLGLLPATN